MQPNYSEARCYKVFAKQMREVATLNFHLFIPLPLYSHTPLAYPHLYPDSSSLLIPISLINLLESFLTKIGCCGVVLLLSEHMLQEKLFIFQIQCVCVKLPKFDLDEVEKFNSTITISKLYLIFKN